jgi:hypothetical protein
MSVSIGAKPLRGDLVRLEPLTEDHVPGLALAAEEDRSAYGYTMVPGPARRHGNPRTWPGRDDLCAVEIGGTWLAASAQRTGINTESKAAPDDVRVRDPERGPCGLQD